MLILPPIFKQNIKQTINYTTNPMKSNLLIAAICTIFSILAPPAIAETVKVDATNFPDANFRRYIQEKLNEDNTDKLPYDEVSQTINTDVSIGMDCRGYKIESLKGIEHFKSISVLQCGNNHLLSIALNPSIDYVLMLNFGDFNGPDNTDSAPQFRTFTTQSVNLKEHDPDFDPGRVRNLTGAEWENQDAGIIKFNDGETTATYEYLCTSAELNDSEKDKYYMKVRLTLEVRIPLDEKHFPDANFRECLKTAINAESGNNSAYDSETNTIRVADVHAINCNAKGIKNLKGIELFPNLGMFFCKDNNLIAFNPHPKADIWSYDFSGQSYDIGNSTKVDLATVDSAFDPAKVTDLEGAELNGTTLSFGEHSFEATYTYHPIDGHPERSMSVEIIRYAEGMEINETNFASPSFREFLLNSDDMAKYRKDGKISLGINKMVIGYQHDYVTSLEGIEHFRHLQILDINDRKVGKSLVTVDLPTSLVHLYCSNVEGLTEIKNLDKLINLESLNIANNRLLTKLDVTNNTKLKKLSCGSDGESTHETGLEKLTLPSDPSRLEELDCSRSKLIELDLTACTGLKFLKINFARKLSNLIFPVGSKTADGKTDNQVQTITCDNCNLESIDLSNCVKLRRLECSNNILASLDVSACVALDTLACGNPLAYNDSKYNHFGYKELDLSNNKTLKWLECMHTQISKLDLSKHENLEYINCGLNINKEEGMPLDLILPEKADRLRTLNCGSNGLTTQLDNIGIYPELKILECAENQIEHLDVSKNTKLWYLYARVNKYKELDVTKNEDLRHLTCSYTQIKTLDVSKNTKLRSLNCNNTELTMLDLSNNTELDTLHVELCHLIALDLTKQTKLFDIKLNGQRRDLGLGSHFNMKRRNGQYSGNNIQDLKDAIFSNNFVGNINTEEDEYYNFTKTTEDQSGTGETPENTASTQAETGDPDFTLWLTFDEGKNTATYNYQTGGIYNHQDAKEPETNDQTPETPATPASKAVKSKPMRAQSVPEVYGDAGEGRKYALMDVTVTRTPIPTTSGIEDVRKESTAVSVSVEEGAVVIDGAEGRIAIYTTSGTLAAVATADGLSTRIPLPSGFYVVVTSTSTEKILVP